MAFSTESIFVLLIPFKISQAKNTGTCYKFELTDYENFEGLNRDFVCNVHRVKIRTHFGNIDVDLSSRFYPLHFLTFSIASYINSSPFINFSYKEQMQGERKWNRHFVVYLHIIAMKIHEYSRVPINQPCSNQLLRSHWHVQCGPN